MNLTPHKSWQFNHNNNTTYIFQGKHCTDQYNVFLGIYMQHCCCDSIVNWKLLLLLLHMTACLWHHRTNQCSVIIIKKLFSCLIQVHHLHWWNEEKSKVNASCVWYHNNFKGNLSHNIHMYQDSNVHDANMGPTWVLSAPDGPHVGPMNLAIRVFIICNLVNHNLGKNTDLWKKHYIIWPHLLLHCINHIINQQIVSL